MRHMIDKRTGVVLTGLLFVIASAANAQFGGRPGDVVLFAVTANGGADLLAVPPTTTNSPQSLANFKVETSDSVPLSTSAPFGLLRQVFYEQPNELFEVGIDAENAVGLHRTFLVPTKLFLIQGAFNPIGNFVGNPNIFISLPQSLDVEGDISLEQFKFLIWAPTNWPFIAPTNQRGPVGPPDVPGWLYLFQLPGGLVLPSLLPWTNLSVLYPNAGWQEGVDLKLLEVDSALGSTTRLLRLRPGKQTTLFHIPGHTHLFVLQGSVSITPAGSGTVTLHANDYAFLPENFVVTLSNPQPYEGPGAAP